MVVSAKRGKVLLRCYPGGLGFSTLVSLGESGKNFIGIGKRPPVSETMLGRAVPLRADGISTAKEKQCRSANWEKATWRFRLSG